jgi:Na+-translocating ferredoxin:NAD+ oxidoreductase RnfG subunit
MDQFAGKKPDQLDLSKGINAKSGCTITSKAIVNAAKDAVKKIESAVQSGAKS